MTHLTQLGTVLGLRPPVSMGAIGVLIGSLVVGACSFDSSAGVGSPSSTDACSPSEENCEESQPTEDAGPDSEDTATEPVPDVRPDAGDGGSPDARCPSGDCSCDYNGTSTGVCSNGTLEEGNCKAPESWIREEGNPDGCGDDLDNDCDGETNENCECSPGETESCYTGPEGTAENGVCARGERTCNSDGTWSMCEGETTPSEEQCDSGMDEDCSGTADDGEGCACSFKSGDGVCSDATFNADGTCTAPPEYEQDESDCEDGLDNDCDGNTDAEESGCPGIAAGESCQASASCRSGVCVQLGGGPTRCTYRIFVTSQEFSPDFGGLSGADQECQNAASAQGLKGTWKAVMSVEGEPANSRIDFDAPLLNLNRDVVAQSEPRLWDPGVSLESPVGYDASGSSANRTVWTGSNGNGDWDGEESGDSGNDCSSWTSTDGNVSAEVGDSSSTSEWLIGAGTAGAGPKGNNLVCNGTASVYCIDGQ